MDYGTLAALNPVRFQTLDLELLAKYLDDCLVCVGELKPGVRWCQAEEALIWSPELEKEALESGTTTQVLSHWPLVWQKRHGVNILLPR